LRRWSALTGSEPRQTTALKTWQGAVSAQPRIPLDATFSRRRRAPRPLRAAAPPVFGQGHRSLLTRRLNPPLDPVRLALAEGPGLDLPHPHISCHSMGIERGVPGGVTDGLYRTTAGDAFRQLPHQYLAQGIRSTHSAREDPGSNGSPKYWVSRATFPSRNSIMLTV